MFNRKKKILQEAKNEILNASNISNVEKTINTEEEFYNFIKN